MNREGRAEAVHASRRFTEDAVIVAEEVLPSAIVELDFARVRAIASDTGGWTSHTAIIARGLGIPAVVGTRTATQAIKTGQRVRLNGASGLVEILG